MLTPTEIKYEGNDCKAKAIITSSEKVSQIIDLKKEGKINFIISFGEAVQESISFNDLINTVTQHYPGLQSTSMVISRCTNL